MSEMRTPALLSRPRLLGGFLALASAAMLAGAFYFQHVEGLAPCPLCIAQRWAHGASLALGLITLVFARGAPARWLLAATGLALVAGAGIAGYHVGVEQHWIESSFCGSSDLVADTVEELKALLWETDVVACDEVAWSLAGVSMAGYNFIISGLLALLAFAGATRARKAQA